MRWLRWLTNRTDFSPCVLVRSFDSLAPLCFWLVSVTLIRCYGFLSFLMQLIAHFFVCHSQWMCWNVNSIFIVIFLPNLSYHKVVFFFSHSCYFFKRRILRYDIHLRDVCDNQKIKYWFLAEANHLSTSALLIWTTFVVEWRWNIYNRYLCSAINDVDSNFVQNSGCCLNFVSANISIQQEKKKREKNVCISIYRLRFAIQVSFLCVYSMKQRRKKFYRWKNPNPHPMIAM